MLSSDFFTKLSKLSHEHSKFSSTYQLLKSLTRSLIDGSDLKSDLSKNVKFGEFGELIFPFYSFGNIDTLDLFGIDELIIFSFYLSNQKKYKKVLDIGGNLGLHTILMSKIGWEIKVYEPDPIHIALLKRNLELNKCLKNIKVLQNAVLDKEDELEFTRVLGNTTGSHISGKKSLPYGEIDKFKVKTVDIKSIIQDVDFIKLDAEGAELDIITSLEKTNFERTDLMIEISSYENAKGIYKHISDMPNVNMFSQLSNWNKVNQLSEMPNTHKDGSIFISKRNKINFQ